MYLEEVRRRSYLRQPGEDCVFDSGCKTTDTPISEPATTHDNSCIVVYTSQVEILRRRVSNHMYDV